ncbi:hypothetical protein ACFQZ4_42000 [Catellatospora coxensis]|uniref:Uncharacterized protein n=2 Tax=Catellatospora coxensis TaxID=310354 RepID=A0A8J3L8J7_9ACTN|nr:hypothetical protein Cco03nite_71460 [Catellatospora coxensis]
MYGASGTETGPVPGGRRELGDFTGAVRDLRHGGDTGAARACRDEALALADFIGTPERRDIRASTAELDAGPCDGDLIAAQKR